MPHRFLPPSQSAGFSAPPRMLAATLLGMMRSGVQRKAPPSWVEPRGVYWAKHLAEGRRLAYAVDSYGEIVKRIRVHPRASEDEAIAYLWEYLEAANPITKRRLALVRSR